MNMPDETSVPVKRPRGNPNFVRGNRVNPGGVVQDSRKNIRKALLKLLDQKPDKVFKPQTKSEQIALSLYEATQSGEGKVRILALKEIIDRADGRTAPSKEETDAIASSGSKVLIIDRAGRPPRKPEEQ